MSRGGVPREAVPTPSVCKSLAAEINDPAGRQTGFTAGAICHFYSLRVSKPGRASPALPPTQVAQPNAGAQNE